jgi:hypothetical protein
VQILPTHLVFGQILFVVLVEEANLEDDIGVGNALSHVEVPQRVPHQHDVFSSLKLRVVDCTLGLRVIIRFLKFVLCQIAAQNKEKGKGKE